MADEKQAQLKHADLERFVTETLSKREPCPAMVLAWGWLMKQGEGGIFHGDSYKQRFFVLARVPHATVLIYYGERTMDEENILGFIDLRKVQAVREGVKSILLDGPKQGLMSKLFARGQTPVPMSRHVVELVTAREVGRVYNLAPATIHMPAPMTSAAALANAAGSKPLYLFGWPFPVPAIDGVDEEGDVQTAFNEDKLPEDNFAQWRDVLATAVAAEKATHTYPVTTLVDSTGQLPQRVYLRTTPCELAIVSMEDKDLCFAALPYNDLLKWECPVESEIHVTSRTRARLVAKPDRTGFTSQRPTRSTCHFVFKCTQAKAVISVIDNHLRALAKQLSNLGDGADEAEVADADAAGDGGDDGDGAAEENDAAAAAAASAAAASKLTSKKPAPAPAKKAAPADDDEDERPAKKSSSSSSKKTSRRADDDDEEEEAKPAKKSSSSSSSSKKSSRKDDDSEEEEEAPKKSSRSSSSKKSSSSSSKRRDDDEEEEEEEAPKKSSSRKKTSRKADDDSD